MELKINKFTLDGRYLIAMFVLAIILIDPAYAQAWATKADTAANQIVDGLKILGRTVAIMVGIWGALMIFTGRKQVGDMVNWFVGAAVFISVTEMVNLFFKQ